MWLISKNIRIRLICKNILFTKFQFLEPLHFYATLAKAAPALPPAPAYCPTICAVNKKITISFKCELLLSGTFLLKLPGYIFSFNLYFYKVAGPKLFIFGSGSGSSSSYSHILELKTVLKHQYYTGTNRCRNYLSFILASSKLTAENVY